MVEVDKRICRPQMGSQFFPRDDLARPLDQHHQNLKRLLLKPDLGSIATQFSGAEIGLEDSELDRPRPITRHRSLPFLEPAKFSRAGVFQICHLSS
jgi:hypothetical protein